MWEISSFGLRSTVSSAEAGRSIEINQDLKLVVKKVDWAAVDTYVDRTMRLLLIFECVEDG